MVHVRRYINAPSKTCVFSGQLHRLVLPEMLGVLLEMGFSEAVCVKALLLNVYDVLGVIEYVFNV